MDKSYLPRAIAIEEFLPLVGMMFDLDCSPNSVAIRLIEATPSGFAGYPDRTPFSLIFHSTPDILLVAGLYTMKCGPFGPDVIHISPIMAPLGAAPGYYYQAVFN